MILFVRLFVALSTLTTALAASSAFAGTSLPDTKRAPAVTGQAAPVEASLPGTTTQVEIAPINSRPYGKSYSEWTAEWWQWALQTPTGANPLIDDTGEVCTVGQHGRLWFLVGDLLRSGPKIRKCRVPRDTALLIPVVNNAYFAFLSDSHEQRTERFCRSQVEIVKKQASLSLRVDGKPVGELRDHFVRSILFTVQLPRDNLLGATTKDVPHLLLRPSCDAGYYVILYPLTPGNHTVSWTAPTNSQNITYKLSIY